MKKFLRMLTEKANEFINDKKIEQDNENNTAILSAIELALKKKSGIHVIFKIKALLAILLSMTKNVSS